MVASLWGELLAEAVAGKSLAEGENWKRCAGNALRFDAEADEKVVYSAGTRIYHFNGDKPVELVSGSLIQSVTVIDV